MLAIADELTEDGLVLRYKVDTTDTGFAGKEGTFTICSFWLVTALAMIGEQERARALCQKLLAFAGPLQLYAEEIDAATGEHLGNFPQAFTHLALIDAVGRLIEAERRRQLALETNGTGPRPHPTTSAVAHGRERRGGPSMAEHYDVIIIGTGAGGGTLAHTLAPSGKRILLLERGGFLPREKENWDPESVFIKGRYVSPDSWQDKGGNAFQPGVHYYVGGATKLYGAALYRLRPGDFGELTHVDGGFAGLARLL